MTHRDPTTLRPNAWLLDFGQSLRAATGTRTLLQIIEAPALHAVPCVPSYCRSVLPWQDRLLPVMDIAVRMGGEAQSPRLLAVTAYRDQASMPAKFGALLLSSPPTAIRVSDAQACELPEHPAGWDELALSCFDYEGAPVPILDLGRLFTGPAGMG